jgi:hypothetical protein
MGGGVAYTNVQDEQQPASCGCMLHGIWGCRWGSFSQWSVGSSGRRRERIKAGWMGMYVVGITCPNTDGALTTGMPQPHAALHCT